MSKMVDEFSILKIIEKKHETAETFGRVCPFKSTYCNSFFTILHWQICLVVLLITHNLDYYGLKIFDAKVTWNEK